MKQSLFKEKTSIEEKKTILIQELGTHLDLDSTLVQDGVKSLSLVDNNDKELNKVLEKANKLLNNHSTVAERLKMLLTIVIIFKNYPEITSNYSQESIIVLAKSCSYNETCYYRELNENVSKYNDAFLREIYLRHSDIGYIDNDFTVMDMIYEEFLASSSMNKKEKNNKLLEMYKLMSNKKLMDIYRISQTNDKKINEFSKFNI